MNSPRSARYDAVVIGAGLDRPGLRLAARRRGLSVLVVERAASRARARRASPPGMLAPVTEADFGEEAALRLSVAGRERWPAFAAELEERTGRSTGFRETARWWWPPTATMPRSSAACTRSRARSGLDDRVAHAARAAAGWSPALSPRVAGGDAGRRGTRRPTRGPR